MVAALLLYAGNLLTLEQAEYAARINVGVGGDTTTTFPRRFIMRFMRIVLSAALALLMLAGCAGMRDTSGTSTSPEGLSGPGTTDQMRMNRHDNPSDLYFGG
jgi:hypothetical protein